MRRLAWVMMVAVAGSACSAENTDLPLAKVEVKRVDGVVLQVTAEVAQSAEEREIGLMNRKQMDAMHGMLFVWPEAGRNVFWMKDTLIPLDIMFIRDGKIVAIAADAKPMDETPLNPGVDSDAVLEVNGGWAAAHQVGAGAQVSIQP